MVSVGEVDVVEEDVGELDFAQDPPEAHDEGVAWPEGPGRVPRRVRICEFGGALEGKGRGLFGGPRPRRAERVASRATRSSWGVHGYPIMRWRRFAAERYAGAAR